MASSERLCLLRSRRWATAPAMPPVALPQVQRSSPLRFWEPSLAGMIEPGAAIPSDLRSGAIGVMVMLNRAARFSPPIAP